jgi:ribonuclease VapC
MIIGPSALLAILFGEPEADTLVAAILGAPRRQIGAPAYVEASAVLLQRRRREGLEELDELLRRLAIEIVPMSVEAARAARSAYARFGKGVGRPGVLNLGDCLVYGIAVAEEEPLLFKGDDFSQTDVSVAAY